MVAHEHCRTIFAEAPEPQRRVDLLPNTIEYGTEIRFGPIQTKTRDEISEIKRVVTTIKSRYLSPADHRRFIL